MCETVGLCLHVKWEAVTQVQVPPPAWNPQRSPGPSQNHSNSTPWVTLKSLLYCMVIGMFHLSHASCSCCPCVCLPITELQHRGLSINLCATAWSEGKFSLLTGLLPHTVVLPHRSRCSIEYSNSSICSGRQVFHKTLTLWTGENESSKRPGRWQKRTSLLTTQPSTLSPLLPNVGWLMTDFLRQSK